MGTVGVTVGAPTPPLAREPPLMPPLRHAASWHDLRRCPKCATPRERLDIGLHHTAPS